MSFSGLTCTAGARRVESIVLQRPWCSGGVCEELCALKFMSFSGLTRESTGDGLSGQLLELCPEPRVALLFSTIKIVL